MSRVLSLNRVMNLPLGSRQWIEFNLKNVKSISYMFLLKGHLSKDRIKYYNIEWRVWNNKPTSIERKNKKWKINDVNNQ